MVLEELAVPLGVSRARKKEARVSVSFDIPNAEKLHANSKFNNLDARKFGFGVRIPKCPASAIAKTSKRAVRRDSFEKKERLDSLW